MPMQQWIPPGIMSGGIPLPQPAPGPANTPPGPQGPLWLQKFAGGFNKFANGLSGYSPSPYLSDAENQALQQRQRAATFAQLAASSGPTVAGTTGPLQAFGQATAAGLNAGQSGVEDAIKARLANAQMQHANSPQALLGVANPSDFTPESLSAYLKSRDPKDLVPIERIFGKVNPRDYTPESFAAFSQTRNPADLVRIAPFQFQTTPGGGIVGLDPITGKQVSEPLTSKEGTQQAAEKAGAETSSKEAQTRMSTMISEGYKAADALPIVNRGIELLDEVKTGGLNNVALKATNFFGVTGANEAELSANLGKAVLAQLRSTFGAQFTENEGRRLQEIEAGFGKSTEGNKRLLEQARKLVDRVARRGIDAAKRSGNQFDADEIGKAMQFTLSPSGNNPGATPARGANGLPDVSKMTDEELNRLAGGK